MPPVFWLLAGPNGSGKSTLAAHGLFDRLLQTPETSQPLVRINPDAIARSLPESSDRALKAAQLADAEVDRLIAARCSLLVETVLSTDKFLARVKAAKSAGFRVGLIYVVLRDPDLNVGRVAQRVALGGHDVPEDRVRARWQRSLSLLPRFAQLADVVQVWDNSFAGAPPDLLLERIGDAKRLTAEGFELISNLVDNPVAPRELLKAIEELAAMLSGSKD